MRTTRARRAIEKATVRWRDEMATRTMVMGSTVAAQPRMAQEASDKASR